MSGTLVTKRWYQIKSKLISVRASLETACVWEGVFGVFTVSSSHFQRWYMHTHTRRHTHTHTSVYVCRLPSVMTWHQPKCFPSSAAKDGAEGEW